MAKFKFKYQMYKHLQTNIAAIYADARAAADELGIPKELQGQIRSDWRDIRLPGAAQG